MILDLSKSGKNVKIDRALEVNRNLHNGALKRITNGMTVEVIKSSSFYKDEPLMTQYGIIGEVHRLPNKQYMVVSEEGRVVVTTRSFLKIC